MTDETRMDEDSMGAVEVPADRLWGAQTERARSNFAIGDARFGRAFIEALGRIKAAMAHANREVGIIDAPRARVIERAAREVASGALDEHFPLSVWQSGSGTQTNMNANEVIARRATMLLADGEPPVHPNDEVNRGQSSNDVIPTAMHLSAVGLTDGRLVPEACVLIESLAALEKRAGDLVKIGRTHLQDAVPMRFAAEVHAWRAQLEAGVLALGSARDELLALPLGGTAIGTGLNAHPDAAGRAIDALAVETGVAYRPALDRASRISAHDGMVALHGALRRIAVVLVKIANDVRWLSSGPRAGIAEIRIPHNEPGSSIMPGKVNPTQAESLVMVSYRVMANDVAVTLGGASGNFQLNVCKPLIAHATLESLGLLADAMGSFARRCVDGIEPAGERMSENVRSSLMLATALTPSIGYDRAAAIASDAHARGVSLEAAARDAGMSESELRRILDPGRMADGGVLGAD